MACSLANFDDSNPNDVLNTPRSLKACKLEGVLPQELTFKPLEAFQEKNLSPRLVKLRFDFFEAKRRDLLIASKRAYDIIISEEQHDNEKNTANLALIAKESGLTKANILAINSGKLALEREKLQRAQESQRNWLKNALNNELRQLQEIQDLEVEEEDAAAKNEEKDSEIARRLKEHNDRKQQEEERKHAEAEAKIKFDKQVAKEEFHKKQEEIKKNAEVAMKKEREAYKRQLRDLERKKQIDAEKEEKRQAAFKEQEAKKAELRAQDLRRTDILEEQRTAFQKAIQEKKDMRDRRLYDSIQANMSREEKQRLEFEERQRIEQQREERLMQIKAADQEESAKKSFQTMMRRKIIEEENLRKQEARRAGILEVQEETDFRLLDHEQKKERYLQFKRELDSLRYQNREINVARQRRREEAAREMIAEQVRKKDEKVEHMNKEKARLWQIRRAQQSEAYRARELVKGEIMKQRVSSKLNVKALEKKMSGLKILKSSSSMPALNLKESRTCLAAAEFTGEAM